MNGIKLDSNDTTHNDVLFFSYHIVYSNELYLCAWFSNNIYVFKWLTPTLPLTSLHNVCIGSFILNYRRMYGDNGPSTGFLYRSVAVMEGSHPIKCVLILSITVLAICIIYQNIVRGHFPQYNPL